MLEHSKPEVDLRMKKRQQSGFGVVPTIALPVVARHRLLKQLQLPN